MMEKRKYEEPVCEIKKLAVEDVITTSGDDWETEIL